MNHYQLNSVNVVPVHKSHQHTTRTKKNQRDGNMVLRSGTTATHSKPKRQGLSKQFKVRHHIPILCTCFKRNGKQRKDANKDQIEAIGEIALNLLKGNIVVPKSSFTRLKPHKSKFLYLTRKKPSLILKKQVLNQKGGLLPSLAALIAPLAVDLLGKVLK